MTDPSGKYRELKVSQLPRLHTINPGNLELEADEMRKNRPMDESGSDENLHQAKESAHQWLHSGEKNTGFFVKRDIVGMETELPPTWRSRLRQRIYRKFHFMLNGTGNRRHSPNAIGKPGPGLDTTQVVRNGFQEAEVRSGKPQKRKNQNKSNPRNRSVFSSRKEDVPEEKKWLKTWKQHIGKLNQSKG
jgi:hypothetical protein